MSELPPYVIKVTHEDLRATNFENLLKLHHPILEKFGFIKLCPPENFWDDKLYDEDLDRKLDFIYRQNCTNHQTKIGKREFEYQIYDMEPVEAMSVAKYMMATRSEEHQLITSEDFYAAVRGPDPPCPLYAADCPGSRIRENEFVDLWNLLTSFKIGCRRSGYSASGVTTPMLYYGCRYSRFCWHIEDMTTFSISILHSGAAKTWVVMSPKDKMKFEELVKGLVPSKCKKSAKNPDGCPAYLMHKEFGISSEYLTREGINCTTVDQYPGQIIIVYPGSFHSGWNNGTNEMESVNFATDSWLKIFHDDSITKLQCQDCTKFPNPVVFPTDLIRYMEVEVLGQKKVAVNIDRKIIKGGARNKRRSENKKGTGNKQGESSKGTHRCTSCGYTSGKLGNVSRHFNEQHVESSRVPCTLCEETFRNARSLSTHMSYSHGGVVDDAVEEKGGEKEGPGEADHAPKQRREN